QAQSVRRCEPGYKLVCTTETVGGKRVCDCEPAPTTVVSAPAWAMAVDSANVYFTNQDGVKKAGNDFNGGPVTTLVAGLQHPVNIAIDATDVYFTANDQGLMKCAKSGCGGNPTFLAPVRVNEAMAMDAQYVYFNDDDNLMKCAKSGC